MNFEDAKEIMIKMTKSEDGEFHPKNMYIYLDGEAVPYVSGFNLSAEIDNGVNMEFTQLEVDEDGNPIREDDRYKGKKWSYVLYLKEDKDQDEIELVEEEEKNDR